MLDGLAFPVARSSHGGLTKKDIATIQIAAALVNADSSYPIDRAKAHAESIKQRTDILVDELFEERQTR